jgi:hypothetical protein
MKQGLAVLHQSQNDANQKLNSFLIKLQADVNALKTSTPPTQPHHQEHMQINNAFVEDEAVTKFNSITAKYNISVPKAENEFFAGIIADQVNRIGKLRMDIQGHCDAGFGLPSSIPEQSEYKSLEGYEMALREYSKSLSQQRTYTAKKAKKAALMRAINRGN